MKDLWHFFPASMGDHQAFIFFNHGFADIAAHDSRRNQFRVGIELNTPDPRGLPTHDEYAALSALEDDLSAAVERIGGVYVGRVTVDRRRYFYFFVDHPERASNKAVKRTLKRHGYRATMRWLEDPQKRGYWDDLYPTADDWQVIKDQEVLDVLQRHGDDPDRERTVYHWAYVPARQQAERFAAWLEEQGYRELSITEEPEAQRHVLRFQHRGTMRLADITHHTIALGRQARSIGADYDGWETSVEQPDAKDRGREHH